MNALAKKLQVKPGKRWLFYNAPDNYLTQLEPLPDGVEAIFDLDGEFDGVQLFVKNSDELADTLPVVVPVLKPDSIFWITYPKKSSGIKSDLEMMGNWDIVGKYGYNGVSAAAVDDIWTALRFRPIGQSKVSESRNEAIKGNNEYADYIDVDNKQVKLPADVEQALTPNAAAMAFYQSLSYSNRKEYVVWILSAKQEKTRNERLEKMIEKLQAGKKNPSEK
ncbi:YdeI/OmpD-associated family protein [Mucilaginibacter sp. BJC16-A38]|uniref:YdeI/OmpD-associated family protein n=1 Tax=Mucilaginibacter phenanthrenivorans TaxID=1234842 RepID=UPI0021572180|nr:YdeI/OmpD-associated family protein [Mucilaginibacter phenanthrenivorans]MCR8557136.1 YdeI/OmpD-associated family protein [Mucilaginibacter phenanthrenivorans]